MAVAEKALRAALATCLRVRRSDDYSPAHVSRVRRDLLAALGAVERVRRVVPGFDLGDPDFQPTLPYERPSKEAPPEVEEEEDEPEAVPVVNEEIEDGT